MTWDQLRDIALVGTSKRRSILSEIGIRQGAEERTFIDIVTKVHFNRQVGKRLPTYQGDLGTGGITEDLPYLSTALETAFASIKKCVEPERSLLYYHWITILADEGLLANPAAIVDVLKEGNRTNKAKKQKIKQVVGKRGEMIINTSSRFKYEQGSVDKVWLHGKSKDRQDYLEKEATNDPIQAITLLNSTWDSESLRDKKAFIQVIAKAPKSAYLDFVYNLYKLEFAFHSKEKKTETECRYLLGRMLLFLGNNDLHTKTCEILSSAMTTEKKKLLGLITRGNHTSLDLQQISKVLTEDDANQLFGMNAVAVDPALHENQVTFYLSHIVENLPTTDWSAIMDMTLDQWVDYVLYDPAFVVTKAGKKTSIFRKQIVSKTLVYRDAGLVKKLLELDKSDLTLLTSLTTPTYEAYIIKNRMLRSLDAIVNAPGKETLDTWSKQFSLKAMESVFEQIMSGGQFPTKAYISSLCLHLSPDILEKLDEYRHRASNSGKLDYWDKHIYSPIKHSLTAKYYILQHLTNTTKQG